MRTAGLPGGTKLILILREIGTDTSKPVYVAIKGVVFDVSGKDAYLPPEKGKVDDKGEPVKGGAYHGRATPYNHLNKPFSTLHISSRWLLTSHTRSLRGQGRLSSPRYVVGAAAGRAGRVGGPKRRAEKGVG